MVRSVLTVLALIAALVGCGSDSDSSSDPAAESSSERSADADAGVIAPEEAHDLVENGAALVDVRNPDEYAAGHLEGAVSIPLESGDFDAAAGALDPDQIYVLYCETGRRAGVALERMTALGFADVVNAGGMDDLVDVVGPVVTGD
ncbi:rhodanese-like domain-containing protein [Nocardioides sp. P5_C9_2]